MIYVYDMILNWNDKDKIYEFFEWELNDEIEHIKRMPLLKISSNKFDELFNYEVKVDDEFLKQIHNLTEKYTDSSVEKIEYAAILTDGVRTFAIEFNSIGNAIYRSRLLLDEEQEVSILSNKLFEFDINYKKGNFKNKKGYTTRLEEDIKRIITVEINDSYKKRNFDKLKYLYFELFDKEQDDVDLIYNKLLSSIDQEINCKHNKLYEVIKLSYQNKS